MVLVIQRFTNINIDLLNMTDKKLFVLSDKDTVPDDNLIFLHLGEMRKVWLEIMGYIRDNYKDAHGEWRYYKDAGQWLFRMQYKKKTLFWIALLDGAFRITFYFGKKAEPAIDAGNLPGKIKDEFKTSKQYGLFKAISLIIPGDSDSDSDTVKELISIKHKIK